MKKLGMFFVLMLGIFAASCAGDDDICLHSEGTPRLKMKFKDSAGRLATLDSLYISADYGGGTQAVVQAARVDSVLVPLRIDGSGSTLLEIRRRKAEMPARLQLQYAEQAEYVSPACGIRKLYRDVRYQLHPAAGARAAEPAQNEITDEIRTHLYITF